MDSNRPCRRGGEARSTSYELKSETFPDWLVELESRRVLEYTDVNEAEKRMMIMWNSHVSKCNVTGDIQIPWACRRFVELHGGEIMEQNLYRNFCLHLTNLFDFGLLSLEDVRDVIDLYHSQRKAATKSMEVSGENDNSEGEVKIVYEKKRKSSTERSPLKKLNLEENELFTDNLDYYGIPSPVRRRVRELSSTPESEVDFYAPKPNSKYPMKSRREKFPSYK